MIGGRNSLPVVAWVTLLGWNDCPLIDASEVNWSRALEEEKCPKRGNTSSGLLEPEPEPLSRGWFPACGMPSRLEKRIEPEKSMTTATSRGRWAATATAWVLKVSTP